MQQQLFYNGGMRAWENIVAPIATQQHQTTTTSSPPHGPTPLPPPSLPLEKIHKNKYEVLYLMPHRLAARRGVGGEIPALNSF